MAALEEGARVQVRFTKARGVVRRAKPTEPEKVAAWGPTVYVVDLEATEERPAVTRTFSGAALEVVG